MDPETVSHAEDDKFALCAPLCSHCVWRTLTARSPVLLRELRTITLSTRLICSMPLTKSDHLMTGRALWGTANFWSNNPSIRCIFVSSLLPYNQEHTLQPTYTYNHRSRPIWCCMPGECYLNSTVSILELAVIGDDGARASQGIYLALASSIILQTFSGTSRFNISNRSRCRTLFPRTWHC